MKYSLYNSVMLVKSIINFFAGKDFRLPHLQKILTDCIRKGRVTQTSCGAGADTRGGDRRLRNSPHQI